MIRDPEESWGVDRIAGSVPVHAGGLRVPRFVNAHTHTEWNAAASLAQGDGMVPWIERVLARGLDAEDAHAGAVGSPDLFRENNIGFVADHGALDSSVARGMIQGRHYREFLRDAVPDPLPEAVAPHAVHTVFESSLSRLTGHDLYISVHAGESREERRLYDSGDGPLANLLLSRGFPREHVAGLQGRSPARILDDHGLLGPRTLVVHAVHLPPEDWRMIAARGARVVLCPASNRAMGTAFARDAEGRAMAERVVKEMLALGIEIALGTDSLVSAPTLSMLDNACILLECGLPIEDVVPMLWNEKIAE